MSDETSTERDPATPTRPQERVGPDDAAAADESVPAQNQSQNRPQNEPQDAPRAAPRQRFVDRVWGIRGLVAVALASLIIGGLAGAGIAKAGEGHDGRPGRFWHGPGEGRMGHGFHDGHGFRDGQGFGRPGPGGPGGPAHQGQNGSGHPANPPSATPSPSDAAS